MKTIKMENRACHGTRLVTIGYLRKTAEEKDYIFGIGYYEVQKKYFVEVQYTYYKKPTKDTYGNIKYFAESPKECIKWIEKNYRVKIKPTDPLIKKAY